MKKLNLLLMMFASLTLFFTSSCKTDDKDKKITEITLSVSGGTEVTLDGTDITKDIIVTASEKATQDIVISLTSNAAEGEATFVSPTITIKQGEKSAVGQITFAAAKFPAGTDQKKITVTINTQTEHVKPDVQTTDFLVMGKDGTKLIPLTIAGSATELNTTAGEQTLTVTATLTEAATEEVSIAIAYDGSAANLIELFKDIKTITIAKDQKTGTVDFKAGQGVEGALKLAFTTANKTVDLQTATLAATFAIDKTDLTITANATEFNTSAEEQTLTVTPTLSEVLSEDLDIAITYDGSDDNMKELFKAVTSIKIAAGETTGPIDFKVAKGIAGKLVVNFAIDNEDVSLKTASLTATFEVKVTPLCAGPANRGNYYMCKQFIVGDYTSAVHDATVAFTNLIETGVVAKVKGGDIITVIGKNRDSGAEDLYKAFAWVDWNNDGLLDDATERIIFEDLLAGENGEETTIKQAFVAPNGAVQGRYAMRIGTGFSRSINEENGVGGCASYETVDFSDLLIDFTPGTVTPPVGEDPTFSVETTQSGDVVVPATGDKEITFQVKLSGAAEEEQTITLAATSTGKNGAIDPTSVTFAAGETSKDVKIKFLSADFTSDAVTATVTVTGSSDNLEAALGKGSIEFKVKGTAATSEKQDIKLYVYPPNDVFFTPGVDEIKVQFNVTGQTAATATSDIVITPKITGGTLDVDYKLEDGNALTIASGSKGGAFSITLLRAGAGKVINVDFNSDLVTFFYEGSTSTDVYGSIYSQPAAPADFKISHEIPATAKAGTWLYSEFQYTEGEEPEVPIFITYSAKDADGNDVTEQVRFPAQPIVLSYGYARGDLLFNSTLAGKVVTITFTSFDTTFATGKEEVTVTLE